MVRTDGLGPTRHYEVLANAFSLSYSELVTTFGPTCTSLNVTVYAVNSLGTPGDPTSPFTVVNPPPEPPTNFVVTGIVDGFTFTWDRSVSTDVVRYDLFIGDNSSFVPSSLNRIFSADGVSAQYTELSYALRYFKIAAVDAFEQYSTYATGSGTAISPFGMDSTPPDVPGWVSATLDRTGPNALVNLAWTFNETLPTNDDIQAFAVRWRKTTDTGWFINFTDKDARALTVELPEPYSDYEFQIASVDNVANYSAYSASINANGSITGNPTAVTVTATAGNGSLQLVWTESDDDVKYGGYYEVTIATNSGFTTGVLNYQTGNTNISVAGLTNGTAYYYRVRAVDSTGLTSAWSATASKVIGTATAITDGAVPASSPAATLTPGIGSLYISWPTVTNADPVTYEVHLGTSSGFTPSGSTKVAETDGTIVTVIKDGAGTDLAYGTTYYAKIRARDADGPASAYGTVSSGAGPRKAATGDIVTIIADQIATGSLGATTITVASGGSIRSTGYVANTTGYLLSDTLVDINSGTVNFKTLSAGTLTTSGLVIGAGGSIRIDSTGEIRSNTYSAGVSGFRIGNTGIELNDTNSAVKANAIIGGTFTGGNFIVGSGGSITSTGFSLASTGLTVTNGTITGATVRTNQLYSNTSSIYTQSGWTFGINSGGYAELHGLDVYGNVIVGNSTAHQIQSGNYLAGSSGWMIRGDGFAELGNATIRGNITGSTITGSTFQTATSGQRVVISPSNAIDFYNSIGTFGGSITGGTSTAGAAITLNGNVNVSGTLFPAGSVVALGGSGVFGTGIFSSSGGNIGGAALTITAGVVVDNWPNQILLTTGGHVLATGQVKGDSIYTTAAAGGGTTGANINNDGRVLRVSTLQMKEAVEEMTEDEARSVLGLKSYTFEFKKEDGGFKDPRRYPGFIGEQAAEAGAELWVARQHKVELDDEFNVKKIKRDKNGPVIGFRTEAVTVAHNWLINDLYAKIEELQQQVADLTARD